MDSQKNARVEILLVLALLFSKLLIKIIGLTKRLCKNPLKNKILSFSSFTLTIVISK